MLEATEEINVETVVRYVTGLQNEDGSFSGDKWGEVDTRFSFCAVACLALLVRTHTHTHTHNTHIHIHTHMYRICHYLYLRNGVLGINVYIITINTFLPSWNYLQGLTMVESTS